MRATIYKRTPSSNYAIENFETIKEAREYLGGVLKNYKADLPKGYKRQCRWNGRYSITVYNSCDNGISGDDIEYKIFA